MHTNTTNQKVKTVKEFCLVIIKAVQAFSIDFMRVFGIPCARNICYYVYSYSYRCLSDSLSFETIIIFVWNRCGISIVFYEAEASIDIDPRNYVTIFCTIEGGYVVITRRSDEGHFFLQRRPVVGSSKLRLCVWNGKRKKERK